MFPKPEPHVGGACAHTTTCLRVGEQLMTIILSSTTMSHFRTVTVQAFEVTISSQPHISHHAAISNYRNDSRVIQVPTVLRMHKDQEARVARLQQTTDEMLDEYKKKHTHTHTHTHILRKMRVTIDKHMKKQREAKHALVWNVNVDSGRRMSNFTEGTEQTDHKHQPTCACLDCDRRREKFISMQESYLMDAGQDPNSQLANAHMATLLGKGIWNHTVQVQQQTELLLQYTPVSITPTDFIVSDTPGTGATICVTSPKQASDVGTKYNYSDAEDTVTDEEATREPSHF